MSNGTYQCPSCGGIGCNDRSSCDCGRAVKEPVTIEARELRQLAQIAHQAYHDGRIVGVGETWRACTFGVCGRVRSILDEAGYGDA